MYTYIYNILLHTYAITSIMTIVIRIMQVIIMILIGLVTLLITSPTHTFAARSDLPVSDCESIILYYIILYYIIL